MGRITLGLVCSALLLSAGHASAQPNPFEAYEQRHGLQAESRPATAAATKCPDPPKRVAPAEVHGKANTWVVSGRTAFHYTHASNELMNGGEASNATLFFRFSPSIGYFLFDHFELALDIGGFSRGLTRDDGDLVSELGWLFEAAARYHLPLSERFGLIGGVSLGGYVGSSERMVLIDPVDLLSDPIEVNEKTTTGGFVTSLSAAATYFIGSAVQLRMGLEFSFLVGTEGSDGLDKNLDAMATFIGLSLGAAYFF